MAMLWTYLKADFLKLRHTPLLVAHVLIPLLTAAVFIGYYASAPWPSAVKAEAYCQMLGLSLPFLSGVFCTMISEQEQSAGAYQALLTAPQKWRAFLSKLLLLLLLGQAALLLATLAFGAAFAELLGERLVSVGFYLACGLILGLSGIPLYVEHLYLALRFSKGISVGLGIAESLLAALLLTGLGRVIWPLVPPAWPARMAGNLLAACLGASSARLTLMLMLPLCLACAVCLILLYVHWGEQWEGDA